MSELRMTMSRAVEPREVVDMVFGTGALSFPWWVDARLLTREVGGDGITIVETELNPDEDPAVTGQEFIELTHWDGFEDLETTPPVKVLLTFDQIVDAASAVATSAHDLHPDALDDLGAADAIDADLILQRAIFAPEVWPVFG